MTEALAVEGKATSENLNIHISKVVRAKRERVFDAWTRPEMIQQWFGPGEMSSVRASTDVRVGGAYKLEMSSECDGSSETRKDGPAIATGVYQKIISNELLCFTWRGNWDGDVDTLVTVLFKDVPDGTEVTLIHENLPSNKSRESHQQGWLGSLDKLAEFCED